MPWLAAPSPKKTTETWSVPRTFALRPTPVANRNVRPDHAVRAEHSLINVRDVHRAALALVRAGGLAEQLRHHLLQIEALGDAVVVTAVGAEHVVVVPQVSAHTPTGTASCPMDECMPRSLPASASRFDCSSKQRMVTIVLNIQSSVSLSISVVVVATMMPPKSRLMLGAMIAGCTNGVTTTV